MKRTIGLIKLALPLALGAVAWAAADKTTPPRSGDRKDSVPACPDMMQDPGVTGRDEKAMRDFKQSNRAPQTIAKMMEMVRLMGNGDVMVGMTRMMEEMISRHRGMMDGRGGMMLLPNAQRARKGAR